MLTRCFNAGDGAKLAGAIRLRAGEAGARAPQNRADRTSIQNVEATQAALVTEFDVNGLKVIVKRRPGSLTVRQDFLCAAARAISRRRTQASKP